MNNVHPTMLAALRSFAPLMPAPAPIETTSAEIIRLAQQANQPKQVAA
jgi:hypothetical protein